MTAVLHFLYRYGFALSAVLVASALQVSGSFSFFGIVPNLALGILIALLFYFDSFAEILFFAALAAFMLNWAGGLPWELVALMGAVGAAFVLKRITLWHRLVEIAFLAGAATALFVLIADPPYLFLFPGRFGIELLYAEVFAFISLGLLTLWYGPVLNSKS